MAELDEFRLRAREFLATHAATSADGGGVDRHDDGDAAVERGKAFQNALADAGLAALTYPVEFGGAGLDAEHQKVFDEESADYEMPSRQFMVGIGICAPTLLEHGTDEQRRTYLPALLRADAIWCQLFSEPGAGSDVASLQTRAERDGDEWVVNGQKVWTSGAHYADYGLLVARTNRDVPKHRGISMFIVDMHSPGITSRPLRQIDGHAHFNEVFLDDVRLPADAVVGEVDDGWRVTLAMLANERVAIGAGGSSQSLTSDGYGSVLRLAARSRVHRRPDGAPGAGRALRARTHPRVAGHADPRGVGLRARSGPRGLGGQARGHRARQAVGQPRHGARGSGQSGVE